MTETEMLRASKLKATPQRLAILGILLNSNEHPSAEMIHNRLLESNPLMSLATVYKALARFKAAGLAQELSVVTDSIRYDAKTTPHPHFICRVCGAVIDIEAGNGVEEIRGRIADKYDFEIEHAELRFFGKCDNCKK